MDLERRKNHDFKVNMNENEIHLKGATRNLMLHFHKVGDEADFLKINVTETKIT